MLPIALPPIQAHCLAALGVLLTLPPQAVRSSGTEKAKIADRPNSTAGTFLAERWDANMESPLAILGNRLIVKVCCSRSQEQCDPSDVYALAARLADLADAIW